MRVLFCYANGAAHPAAVRALDLYAPNAIRIDTSGPQQIYWRTICKYWDGTDDLVTIEQDNEITAEVLPSFEACDQDWCTFQYKGLFPGSMLQQSLGCTRYSKEMQRRFPHEMIAGPDMVWHLIDFRFGQLFHDLHKMDCHIHGTINHYHDYKRDPLHQRNVVINEDGTGFVTQRLPNLTTRVTHTDGRVEILPEEDW